MMDCDFVSDTSKMFTLTNYGVEAWDQTNPAYLFEHTFIANRYLTKPIVSELELDDGKTGFIEDISNPFGITVHDAHLSLADA